MDIKLPKGLASWVPISLFLVASITACAPGSTDPTPSGSTASQVPQPTMSESPDEVLADYSFYFVGETANGFRLFKEVHEVSDIENDLGSDKGLNALVMLIDGQLPPFDGDHKTLWNNGTKLNSLTRDGATATVDLKLGRISFGAETEMRAIDQIVWTLISNDPTITSVIILVDGKPIESLAGHVDTTQPFTATDDGQVLASVWIDQLDDSELSNPIVMTGSACTFEANVPWELFQNGDLIDTGATTATLACPDHSAWSIELGELPAGDYTLRVFDVSAEDGRLLTEDTKDFTVSD